MEEPYSSSYDSPNAVEHIPVWEHSDIQVGGEDRVEPPDLLVTEEGVRHPHLPDQSVKDIATKPQIFLNAPYINIT